MSIVEICTPTNEMKLTRQFPRLEFVDIHFGDNRYGAWLGSGLVFEVIHDEFLVGGVESKTGRKLRAAFSIHRSRFSFCLFGQLERVRKG